MKYEVALLIASAATAQQALALPKGNPNRCTPSQGLSFVLQHNPFRITNVAPHFGFEASGFAKVPAIPASQTPAETQQVGLVQSSGNAVVYKHGEAVPIEDLNIHHRGYLYSRNGGRYTVTMPGSNDNFMLFWHGKNAVSGYSSANSEAFVTLHSPGKTLTLDLEAGESIPIRFMGANEKGPTAMVIDIKDPSGKSCFCKGENGPAPADCLYSDACDPARGNYKFKPFGQEA